MKKIVSVFTVLLTAGFIFSCQPESDQASGGETLPESGIHIEDPWARPGGEGRTSAAYFLISNFNDQADTLVSVESEVAQTAEVHESYEREEGMMGMREADNLVIPAQSTIRLEQGSFHVMLMQLTKQLSEGDTFQLTLTFQNEGEKTVEIPVRM